MLPKTVFIFYVFAPNILIPVPNSPAFTDAAECQRALERLDPFLPGKTACWPAPYKPEGLVLDAPTGQPVDPGEHID